MPFRSEAQRRFFHAAEERGELPEGISHRWEHETPKSIKSRLPYHKKKTSAASKKALKELAKSYSLFQKKLLKGKPTVPLSNVISTILGSGAVLGSKVGKIKKSSLFGGSMHPAIIIALNDELKKIAAELTTAGREKIKTKNFAIPGKEKYPIHDAAHARNALARVSQHGTPSEKTQVRAAVARKWPGVVGEETKKDIKSGGISKDEPRAGTVLTEKLKQSSPYMMMMETAAHTPSTFGLGPLFKKKKSPSISTTPAPIEKLKQSGVHCRIAKVKKSALEAGQGGMSGT